MKPRAGSSRGPPAGARPRVRLVVGAPARVAHRHVAVLLEVGDRPLRRVDRDVREVRAAEPLELRVEVGEVAALQQRIVGEVDARHDVLRAERDLLGLGEEVVDHPVEHEPPDAADGDLLLRDDLRRVEHVEARRRRRSPRRRVCRPSSHSGKSPSWMASHRSRRWKSGSAPLILTASFQTTDCRPWPSASSGTSRRSSGPRR